jgi:hypothetical protein
MKKTILLVVLLTLVAFISGAIAAAPPLNKFSGDIKSVDAIAMAKSIVVAKAKEEKTFVVTADTKITKGKETLKFEDLKAVMNVVVEYKKETVDKIEKLIAVTIKVSAPKAPPKGK